MVIKKYQDEIKRLADPKVDVMSLENRAYLLSKGYLDIGQEEEENTIIGLNMIKKAPSQG